RQLPGLAGVRTACDARPGASFADLFTVQIDAIERAATVCEERARRREITRAVSLPLRGAPPVALARAVPGVHLVGRGRVVLPGDDAQCACIDGPARDECAVAAVAAHDAGA